MKDDRAHAQTLLRDLAFLNARTARELGPLPAGGVPVEAKRKPVLPKPALSAQSPPTIATDTPYSNKETDMDWTRIATTATLTAAASLSACVADQGAHTATTPPPQKHSEPVAAAVEAPPAPTPSIDGQDAEPERGIPIPAAELRRRILALVGSFESLENLEREHVQKMLQLPLTRAADIKEGYDGKGATAEGWIFTVTVAKLGRREDPSTILVGFDNGVEPWTDQEPTYCTLAFEPLAKGMVAMGYERDKRAYSQGGDMTWGFGIDSKTDNAGFGINISIYELEIAGGNKQVCIKGFNIGGGSLNG